MAEKLPDEVLKEILSPALLISDAEFAFSEEENSNPFAKRSQSTSSLLLVCKRWMRVATPLLYEVVVIRSTAQAQALADALRLNGAFSPYIRKLRMEGGFGSAPGRFIPASPNIRELFVTLDVWSDDNVTGLCRAFISMTLRRLVVQERRQIKNAKVTLLWKAVLTYIEKSSSLDTVEYRNRRTDPTGRGRLSEFAEALSSSSSVKLVVVFWCPETLLSAISPMKNIKSIHITSPFGKSFLRPTTYINPALMEKVFFTESTSPSLTSLEVQAGTKVISPLPVCLPKSNDTAMSGVPRAISNVVWDKVFAFATWPCHPDIVLLTEKELTSGEWRAIRQTSKSLSLVSKLFNEIATPHIFRVANFSTGRSWNTFCELLKNRPELAPLVQSHIQQSSFAGYDLDFLLTSLTGLVQFHGSPGFHFHHLKMLATGSCNTLREICVTFSLAGEEVVASVDLGTLPALEVLHCKMALDRSTLQRCKFLDPKPFISGSFPRLHTLDILVLPLRHDRGTVTDLTSLFVTARTPALKSVKLLGKSVSSELFLQLNGTNIVELTTYGLIDSAMLSQCPKLETLTVLEPNPGCRELDALFQGMCGPSGHTRLSKLFLSVEVPRKTSPVAYITNIAEALVEVNYSDLPKLREIHIKGFDWPTTERDVKKTPACTELGYTMKSYGITVFDGSATPWRERAQVRRSRK
ncbi:hypothetical protein BD410DRAFT_759092 [Rickenella mellea]|uniref:Uncharacterized protein n=1 Tax=Rickenella mellea TaxID=50990 RepID=A0A4R5XFM5_9AGAM|nr:hypothetical protein BD410DRAFT_759092 [Rickenella mellea]